jgi:hypothetical protein
MVKSGRAANLLNMLMQDANYCDNGFIAVLHNLVKVWVGITSIPLS